MARRTDRGRPGGRRPVPRRRRRLLPTIAFGAMALGVVGFLVVLPSVSDACQSVPGAPNVSAARAAAAIARGSDVLIVGDSYTTGRGSSDNTTGWAQDLVAANGWDATIDAVPGSGYVNTAGTGSASRTYLPRIERHRSLDPALVIVQGSQNDWLVDPVTLERRVERTLRTAHEQWPDAVVVALGPSAPQPRAETTTDISEAVAAGARAAGVPFVDAVSDQWFTDANSATFRSTDGQHLNDAGYRYLADRVEGALRELAAPSAGQQCA